MKIIWYLKSLVNITSYLTQLVQARKEDLSRVKGSLQPFRESQSVKGLRGRVGGCEGHTSQNMSVTAPGSQGMSFGRLFLRQRQGQDSVKHGGKEEGWGSEVPSKCGASGFLRCCLFSHLEPRVLSFPSLWPSECLVQSQNNYQLLITTD